MNKKLVVFGSGDMAELAHYYFSNDSEYEVVAFTLDEEYMQEKECLGLPVIAFQNIEQLFPPSDYTLFIALSYGSLNALRKSKYLAAKDMGYGLASYCSSRATNLSDYGYGDNCFILENNTIQPFVRIGNNVTLWSGNHIGHHSVIGDHTFISSHVVVSGGVEIGERCFLGVNATLRDHIKVGNKSVVGAGVLLLEDANESSLYIGKAAELAKVSSSKVTKI